MDGIAFHSAEVKLEYPNFLSVILNNPFSTLLNTISIAGWALGGLHLGLDLKQGTFLKSGVRTFRKCHLVLIRAKIPQSHFWVQFR